MTFAEVHVKRSVILTARLGPDILLVLTMKRQALHRERARAFRISVRWPIYIINSVDKTKFLYNYMYLVS